MNQKLLFIIGFSTVLISTVYSADKDYSFKNDLDRCVSTSDKLCDGASEKNGDCELYQGLKNISMTANLTVEQKTTYNLFVEKCKTEVFAVSTYTSEEKFIQFSSLLSQFSVENSAIYGVIQHQNISTWSSIFTVEKVTIIKQQKRIQYSIELDSNHDCPLFNGLREAAQATGDSNCVNDMELLINTELVDIVQESSIEFEEKTIQIYTHIQEFYTKYTTFESKLKFTKITGFGCFYQFFECVKTYQQVVEAPSLCTGTFPDIPIIVYLQQQLAIYKKTDIKVALQFNQFIQRVNQSFQQTVDVEVRHLWYADYVQQWMVLNYNFCTKYIFTIGFGSFGDCYDFCFCDGFEGPVIVTKPPTTSTTTTTTTSTSTTTTTTAKPSTTTIVDVPVTSTVESVVTTEGLEASTGGFSDAVTSEVSTVGFTEEATSDASPSTSFFTELPSTASSCACVCE